MANLQRASWLIGWIKWITRWTLLASLLFATLVLVGLLPVNNRFRQPDQGVRLLIISNAVHADIIMPRSNGVIDWGMEFDHATFPGAIDRETHVAVGWGDRGFFLETPTWNDLKLSTAANALLLPSSTCVHVVFTNAEYFRDAASVTVSEDQYAELVNFVKSTMKRDATGKFIQIPGVSYSSTDAFFDAKGNYHILNTCNSWVGRGLQAAGVRTPWLSPLPKSPMLYLRNEGIR